MPIRLDRPLLGLPPLFPSEEEEEPTLGDLVEQAAFIPPLAEPIPYPQEQPGPPLPERLGRAFAPERFGQALGSIGERIGLGLEPGELAGLRREQFGEIPILGGVLAPPPMEYLPGVKGLLAAAVAAAPPIAPIATVAKQAVPGLFRLGIPALGGQIIEPAGAAVKTLGRLVDEAGQAVGRAEETLRPAPAIAVAGRRARKTKQPAALPDGAPTPASEGQVIHTGVSDKALIDRLDEAEANVLRLNRGRIEDILEKLRYVKQQRGAGDESYLAALERIQALQLGKDFESFSRLMQEVETPHFAQALSEPTGLAVTSLPEPPRSTARLQEPLPSDVPLPPRPTPPTPPAPPTPLLDIASPPGGKERGFAESRRLDPKMPEEIQASLTSEPLLYDRISNQQTVNEARSLIEKDSQIAFLRVMNSDEPLDRVTAEIGHQLAEESIALGDITKAEGIIVKLAERFTEAGQTVQAAAMWGRLTPAGALRYAETQIAKAAAEGRTGLKLSQKKRDEIVTLAQSIQGILPGYERTMAEMQLAQLLQSVVPPTKSAKAAAILRIAQLLNFKTLVSRNSLGNKLSFLMDNLADVVATPVDVLLAQRTGQRSRVLPNIPRQIGTYAQGFAKEWDAALHGRPSTRPGVSRYGAGVFEDGPGHLVETALRLGFAPDDAGHFSARMQEGLYQWINAEIMRRGLKGDSARQAALTLFANPPTKAIEQALGDGLYAVYEHPNVFSAIAVNVKRTANIIGTGARVGPPALGGERMLGAKLPAIYSREFGLGNFVLNYPQIPGGLLSKATDYSPIAFIKQSHNLWDVVVKGDPKNQKALADGLGRAIAGTIGFTFVGSKMAEAGLVTVEDISPSPKVQALQQTAGVKRFQVNLTGAKRWLLSLGGLVNPEAAQRRIGDQLFTFDWAMPLSASFGAGAKTGLAKKERIGPESVLDQLANIAFVGDDAMALGLDMLSVSNLARGVQTLFRGFERGRPAEGITELLISAPSAFIPTSLSQFNQLFDNTVRETYDHNAFMRGVNMVLAKLPVMAARLPARRDVWGEPMERFQEGSNNPWNVLFNPGFATQYLPSPEAAFLLSLYETTGSTEHLPRIVPKIIKIDKKPFQLSTEQYLRYQEVLGKATKEAVSELIAKDSFIKGKPKDQLRFLARVIGELNDKAKELLRAGVLTTGPRLTPLPPPPTPTPTRTPRPSQRLPSLFPKATSTPSPVLEAVRRAMSGR